MASELSRQLVQALRTTRPRVAALSRQSIKNFSANTSLQANRVRTKTPSRAPAVRRQESPHHPRSTQSPHPALNFSRIGDALPPLSLLNSAHKAGALHIGPNDAIVLIQRYVEAYEAKKPSWERDFCNENNAKPSELTLLGAILNKCNTDAQRYLGKLLTLTASSLGDADATLNLLRPAYRTGTLQAPEYARSMIRLKELAEGNHVQSLVLLGRIMQDTGKESEALQLFERAAKAAPDETKVLPTGVADALVAQGQLLMKGGQQEEAEACYERAALELDYPAGYYYLAQLQESGSSTQEVYLLKAASSGILEAAYELGKLYVGAAEPQSADEAGRQKLLMAKEWLHLAAMGGNGLAMLALAKLMKHGGDPAEGLQWLKQAAEIPEVAAKANRNIESW